MFCFLMALKSKQIANNWSRTSRLCEAAVRSTLQQTDPKLKVVLVCHEPPDWKLPLDPRLEILVVDFPIPRLDTKETMNDKWTKLQRGLIRVGELKPNFVMIMDADDLVSNRLVQYAHSHNGANGWIFRRGYQYAYGSRWIEARNDFSCGTDAIVGAHLIQFPTDMSPEGRDQCCILRWGHTVIATGLEEMGTPLAVLPFRGAVYLVGHGDNDMELANGPNVFRKGWRQWGRELTRLRWCSPSIRREFGIDYANS